MQWPNLPEDYGNGQRHFDMAKAAYDVAEDSAWLIAGGIGYGIYAWSHIWWVAVPAALAGYFIFLSPHKRTLETGRKLWAEDIQAYQEHLERQSKCH